MNRLNATLILILTSTVISISQWSADPTVNTPVCLSTKSQTQPKLIEDGAGGVIITWADYRSNLDNDIYAQRLDSTGVPQWTVNGIPVCISSGHQTDPKICADNSGGAFITWMDKRGGEKGRVFVQRINPSGSPLWAVNGIEIAPDTSVDKSEPEIISDGDGGAIIGWKTWTKPEGFVIYRGYDLYAQRLDSTGIALWNQTSPVPIATYDGPYDGVDLHLISDELQGAIFVWMDENYTSGPTSERMERLICAERVDSSGFRLWGPSGDPNQGIEVARDTNIAPTCTLISPPDSPAVYYCISISTAEYPEVVPDGDHGALIVFRCKNGAAVHMQRILKDGTLPWGNSLSLGKWISGGVGRSGLPKIAEAGKGNAMITYDPNLDLGYEYSVHLIDTSGYEHWIKSASFESDMSSLSYLYQIVSDGEGGAIVSCHSAPEDGELIQAQRINDKGAFLWPDGGLTVASGHPKYPSAMTCAGTPGEPIFTWKDERNILSSDHDIYATRMTPKSYYATVDGLGEFEFSPSLTGRFTALDGIDSSFDVMTRPYPACGIPGRYPPSNPNTIARLGDTIYSVSALNLPQGAHFSVDMLFRYTAPAMFPGMNVPTNRVRIATRIAPNQPFEVASFQYIYNADDSTYTLFGVDHFSDWTFAVVPATTFIEYGWNMLSVPVKVADYRKTILYPSAITDAFSYAGTYQVEDTLRNCTGYWMKFQQGSYMQIEGELLTADSVDVISGWNMIGSLSFPISITNITSHPAGLITSPFFRYSSSYLIDTLLQPGLGYWVKVIQAGRLYLSTSNIQGLEEKVIKIVDSGEIPPLSPGDFEQACSEKLIPKEFLLAQNYPNPFNPSTVINFSLPSRSYTTLKLYDVLGREVATLVSEELLPGNYTRQWNSATFPSGVYYYRLHAGSFTETKKLLLLR